MAWTTPATAVTGDVVPASFWNTYGRDNLAYLKGLLDGTGGSTVVTVPSTLRWGNDALAYLDFITSTRPYIGLDSNDYIEFDRSTNTFKLHIGSNDVLTIDANGKLAGYGSFTSSEQTITNGGSVNINHGLASRPRFVSAWYSGSSSAESSKTQPAYQDTGTAIANQVRITVVSSTQITIINNCGSTIYLYAYAML